MTQQKITLRANKVGRDDISLDIEDCDAERFQSFIENFTNGTFGIFQNLFITRRRQKPFSRDPERTGYLNYFDVRFVASAANVTLECRYLEFDLSLIAIRPIDTTTATTKWYALDAWIDLVVKYNIVNIDMNLLLPKLSGDYMNLEKGGKTRATNQLGRESLFDAVVHLGKYQSGERTNSYLKPYLLTIIQMTSEAICFPPILDAICDMFYSGARLSDDLVDMTNNFSKQCKIFTSMAIKEKIFNTFIPAYRFNELGVVMENVDIEYDETPIGFIVADKHCELKIAEKLERESVIHDFH